MDREHRPPCPEPRASWESTGMHRRRSSSLTIRAFRIHVDQAHLHRAEWLRELPVAAVALVSEPRIFRAPEDLLGLPDVRPPEAEAERLKAHRFERHVPGVHQQVGPGDLLT